MKRFGAFFAVLFLSLGLLVGQVKELQCDDGIDNDDDGKVDCADPNCKKDPVCSDGSGEPTYSTLVMVDSLDQEIGLVVNRLESFETSYPFYAFAGATVAAEVIGTSGQPLTALFNVSSSYFRGNIQGLDLDMRRAVVFADPDCTDAYILAHSPSAALLTAVSASPDGVPPDPAPGTILYVAELGTPVQMESFYSINTWGGCHSVAEATGPILPVVATVDLTVFVPPFTMVLK